jgi:hypothetical protein
MPRTHSDGQYITRYRQAAVAADRYNEEVSSDHAYFVPDAIELIRGADDDGQPLETKILPDGTPNSLGSECGSTR